MAAKAVGEAYGVSKNAALTIVRIPQGKPTLEEEARGRQYPIRYGPYVDAFRLVLEDVRAKGLQGRAVINLSSGFEDTAGRIPQATDDDWEFYDAIREVIDERVVVVTGSGNRGTFRGANPSQPPDAVFTSTPWYMHSLTFWNLANQSSSEPKCKTSQLCTSAME
jgi:hypothetical protein